MSDDFLCQLKVTVVDSAPPIWRRLVVPETMTLKQLHLVLQAVMGWTNYHLYQFQVGEAVFGAPEDDDYGLGLRPAARKRLSALAKEKGGELHLRVRPRRRLAPRGHHREDFPFR